MISKSFLVAVFLLSASALCAQSKVAIQKQQQDTIATVSKQWWCYPLPGAKVISPYGGKRRHHSGTDIKTKANDNIYAAFDGDVTYAGNFYGYGLLIRIQHPNGLETYYSHNSKNLVKAGDHVKAGQLIALTGRTGRATTEHLHFETRVKGKAVNSNKYFDHVNHTIRMNAFKKTKSGYVIK
jgi:murein DD-endopeptidase MepM/ murein hydrolase activator NlpD